MEVLKSFLVIIVVVLSFGVAVIAGQNGLLSARCAARCLTEHKDRLEGGRDRNSHRKFKLLDRCKNDNQCSECMRPCTVDVNDLIEKKSSFICKCMRPCTVDINDLIEKKCAYICKKGESVCKKSCNGYIQTMKAGDCPSPESAIGFEAVCIKSCARDSHCAENKKCCPNTCGATCRVPDYHQYDLPPVPTNISFEESRQGKSLQLTWQSAKPGPGVGLFVTQIRNTTNLEPHFDDNSPWSTLSVTMDATTLLQQVHAGHFYQFRVAMVTENGSQGFSSISSTFKSPRPIERPSRPLHISEGNTTYRKGRVDLTIHWQPPKYSDIPVWKYKITWIPHLHYSSPVFVRITVNEKKVLGNIHEVKLKNLKPGTSYTIRISAIVRHGNRELQSKRSSLRVTTYSPPNGVKEKTFSIYKDIIRIERLRVVDDSTYFDRGSLKARLTWRVSKEFRKIVNKYMIYWEPEDCDIDHEKPRRKDATSIVTEFELYDLQYECQYNVKVNAVTKKGVQGKQKQIRLVTPRCEDIILKGDSLPPECPFREPQVPRKPRRVKSVTMRDNCSISVNLTWKHPRSDKPIDSYLIEYHIINSSKGKALNVVGPVNKAKPKQIQIDKVRWHVINNLKQSEIYMIKIYAISEIGQGKPAFEEILTPQIFPCGSDKDPEPPDKITETPDEVTTVSTTNVDSVKERPTIDIYRTVYYLAIFMSKLFTS